MLRDRVDVLYMHEAMIVGCSWSAHEVSRLGRNGNTAENNRQTPSVSAVMSKSRSLFSIL